MELNSLPTCRRLKSEGNLILATMVIDINDKSSHHSFSGIAKGRLQFGIKVFIILFYFIFGVDFVDVWVMRVFRNFIRKVWGLSSMRDPLG